jgi:hypothetical protein
MEEKKIVARLSGYDNSKNTTDGSIKYPVHTSLYNMYFRIKLILWWWLYVHIDTIPMNCWRFAKRHWEIEREKERKARKRKQNYYYHKSDLKWVWENVKCGTCWKESVKDDLNIVLCVFIMPRYNFFRDEVWWHPHRFFVQIAMRFTTLCIVMVMPLFR